MCITEPLSGVCAKTVSVIIDQNQIISGINLHEGCDGQRQALNALAVGMPVHEFVRRVQDIKCGSRNTSCVAEVAKVLTKYVS